MTGTYLMHSDAVLQRNDVRRLHESLFSLNIGFAITYALFTYADAHYLANAPKSLQDLLQAFAMLMARFASSVVSGRTRSQWLRSVMIREVVFAVMVLGIAFLLYLLVRLCARAAAGRLVFAPISGVAALMAVPISWLYIVYASWSIYDPGTFWGTYGYISVAEIAVAGGLLYFVRNQAIWRGSLVFALHYVFWVLVIGDLGVRSGPATSIATVLFPVFPCSGFAWLRYLRGLRLPQTT